MKGSQCSVLDGDGSVLLAPEMFESFIARVCSPEFPCARKMTGARSHLVWL